MNEKSWRQFEQLIARIEQQLAPQGAVVRSPDHIRDNITGQLREVDASISYQVGSVPILITVECRRRQDVQDDTWIEQLAKKKEKIGASATIAVSSSGFTRPATLSAKQYGIHLRYIEDITDDDIVRWTEDIHIDFEVLEWNFVSINVCLETGNEKVAIDPSVDKLIQDKGYDAEVAFNPKTGETLTLDAIGGAFVKDGKYPHIPRVKPFGRVELPPSTFYMLTNNGQHPVRYFEVMVEINNTHKPVPLKKVIQYSATGEPLVQVAEWKYPFRDQHFTIQFIKPVVDTT